MLNLDPLLDSVDLIQIVEHAGGRPNPSGKRHVCACPIHGGDGPNFSIYEGDDGRLRWHCFSRCQTGGDVIEFVQRWRQIDFIDAVKWLADFIRLPLDRLGWTKEAIQAHKKHLATCDLFTKAAGIYAKQLWNQIALDGSELNTARAQEFVLSRGLPEEHLNAIKWGYSDSSDRLLRYFLADDDHSQYIPLGKETGLIRSDGKDFTANGDGDQVSPDGWIIYPHWHRGKVVYLSARAVSKIEKGSKSRNLPGHTQIYRADAPLNGDDQLAPDLVIVEGPADAETCRFWGYPAWAMMGVSLNGKKDLLSGEINRRASRHTIYLAPSNDQAGRDSLDNLADIAGPLARIVEWPKEPGQDKSDANDWLKQGATAEEFHKLLRQTEPYIDLKIRHSEYLTEIRQQAEAVEHLAKMVCRLAETERRMYIRKIGGNGKFNIGQRDFEKLVRERMEGDPKSGIEIKHDQFYHWGDPLTNFACRITHELARDDGENPPEIIYTVSGKLNSGDRLHPVDVPASDFDSLSWLGNSWGARPIVYIGGGKKHILLRAIKESSLETMTRERIYTFTGWHQIDGKRVFLNAGGALSAQGLDDSVRVDLLNNLALYRLPPPPYGGELARAVQFSLKFLEIGPMSITAPLWAAMYAAPLTPFKSLNAVMWIYGPTQSKKSSIAHLVKCHFGKFVEGRDYKSVKDWMSTSADLEATMFDCKDVPFIIDDYAPQFTDAVESRKQAKTAKNVVRGVGNRSSRGRRRADMTAQKQYIPRGLVLATAEQPLIGQSIVGRTIYVEVDIDAINLDALTEGQHNHYLYRQAMSGYISWLAENWEKLEDTLPGRFNEAQKSVKFPNQDRLADYFAVLKVAADLFLEWGASIGAIDPIWAKELANDIQYKLHDLLSSQSGRISQQSPVLRFFQALEELVAQGDAVLPLRTNEEYIVPDRATLVGWQEIEKNQIYLLTGPALNLVKEYWDNLDERYDTLIDALRREMHQYGFLAKRASRQFEKKMWINKKWSSTGTQRVLVVDARKVKDEFDIDLIEKPESERRPDELDDEENYPDEVQSIEW